MRWSTASAILPFEIEEKYPVLFGGRDFNAEFAYAAGFTVVAALVMTLPVSLIP